MSGEDGSFDSVCCSTCGGNSITDVYVTHPKIESYFTHSDLSFNCGE